MLYSDLDRVEDVYVWVVDLLARRQGPGGHHPHREGEAGAGGGGGDAAADAGLARVVHHRSQGEHQLDLDR